MKKISSPVLFFSAFGIAALSAAVVLTTSAAPPKGPQTRLLAAYVKKELTAHQWVLAEIVQTKNDTATNLTLFMLPCEKDNVLDYETNGTYNISEGEKKCNSSDGKVKGQGTWEYEESDQALMDSYAGGRRIEKKVLELSPGMLKVQYESEGRRITTLTYFSEIGMKDEGLRDLVVDNSDNFKNVMLVPREAMYEARRYLVIGRRDFDRGVPVTVDDKGGVLKKVAVYPFMSSTDQNTTTDEGSRNKALIAQGKKVGLDYIITGNILKASADVAPDNKYQGHVKYFVTILDVKAGLEKKTKLFEYSEKAKEEKAKQNEKALKILGGVAGAASSMSWYYGGWRRGYWNSYYGYYFYPHSTALAVHGLSAAFSNGNNEERQRYYQSSLAVMDALNHTSKDLSEFVIENIPLSLKIARVDDEKKGKITVEGGTNINLQEGEKLKLVRVRETPMSDGTKEIETIEVAELTVEAVNGARLSACKPAFGQASKISKALKENPEELFVHTTELYRPKK